MKFSYNPCSYNNNVCCKYEKPLENKCIKKDLCSIKSNLKMLEKFYESNGSITWNEFKNNPNKNCKKVVKVKQSDFDFCTLRVKYPCKILFTENVVFEPRLESELHSDGSLNIERDLKNDWFPNINISEHAPCFEPDVIKAYSLGFFAYMTVETENVIIDLNGYELKCHERFAIMQRFAANIELADQPFIPRQGPGDFGAKIQSAKKCWIKNGKLGRSPHHNIHGNTNDSIYISDIQCTDAEVASIALNGGTNICIENVVDTGRFDNLPILGNWSALRFSKIFMQHLLPKFEEGKEYDINKFKKQTRDVHTDLLNQLKKLKKIEKEVFDDIFVRNNGVIEINVISDNVISDNVISDNVISDNVISDNVIDNYEKLIFKNQQRVIDGPSYGFLFNPVGIAIGAFTEKNIMQAQNIEITNCNITNVIGSPIEIPSISKSDGTGNQNDISGSIIQYLNVYKEGDKEFRMINENGKYNSSILSDWQISIAKFKKAVLEDGSVSSKPNFGLISIDDNILDWACNKSGKKLLQNCDETKLQEYDSNNALTGVEYLIRRNCDSMHHVMKGMIGIRMDGVTNAKLCNVIVNNVMNLGKKGSGCYTNASDGGHEGQKSMTGYHGNLTKGISLSACKSIYLKNTTILDIISETGNSIGLNIINNSSDICYDNLSISNIISGSKLGELTNKQLKEFCDVPNKKPISHNILDDSKCDSPIHFKKKSDRSIYNLYVESTNKKSLDEKKSQNMDKYYNKWSECCYRQDMSFPLVLHKFRNY